MKLRLCVRILIKSLCCSISDLFESSDVINELFKANSSKGYFGATRTTMNTDTEEELRQDNRLESRLLKLDITGGRSAIVHAKVGHLRPRHQSAPPSRLSSYLGEKSRENFVTSTPSNWLKLQDAIKYARIPKRQPSSPHEDFVNQSRFSKKEIPPIVSEEEKFDLREKMSDINFRLHFPDASFYFKS